MLCCGEEVKKTKNLYLVLKFGQKNSLNKVLTKGMAAVFQMKGFLIPRLPGSLVALWVMTVNDDGRVFVPVCVCIYSGYTGMFLCPWL